VSDSFDWQWHVAVLFSTWTPDSRSLIDSCMTCEGFGLTSSWPSKSQAASERRVKTHSRWHRDTERPNPMVRPIDRRFQAWEQTRL